MLSTEWNWVEELGVLIQNKQFNSDYYHASILNIVLWLEVPEIPNIRLINSRDCRCFSRNSHKIIFAEQIPKFSRCLEIDWTVDTKCFRFTTTLNEHDISENVFNINVSNSSCGIYLVDPANLQRNQTTNSLMLIPAHEYPYTFLSRSLLLWNYHIWSVCASKRILLWSDQKKREKKEPNSIHFMKVEKLPSHFSTIRVCIRKAIW